MSAFLCQSARITLATAVLLMSGCSLLSDRWAGGQQRLSGLLEQSESGFVLRQCGRDNAQAVSANDRLDELFAQSAQPGQTAIFVDLLGRVDSAGRVRSDEVLRMQSHGRGCADRSADAAQWVAVQSKPAWRVSLAANGLTRNDAERSYSPQPVVSEQLPDGSLSARGLEDAGIELWLYPQACQDAITGDYFHMSATLLLNGERYQGCAYQGRQTAP